MIVALLAILALHLCSGRGKIGAILYESCKYDILNDEYDRSAACDGATAGISVINILTLSIVDGMSPSEQAH